MEIIDAIVKIINGVGFPIFSFIACGWALKYVYDRERKSLDATIEKIGALTLAVNANSEAIRSLIEELREKGAV